MKPIAPASISTSEPRMQAPAKVGASVSDSPEPLQDSVVASVSPALQTPEQAKAVLDSLKAAMSPLGPRALDVFSPTDVAKIEKLLTDD